MKYLIMILLLTGCSEPTESDDKNDFRLKRFENDEVICYMAKAWGEAPKALVCRWKIL